jgi:hypothetical protein
LERPGLNRHIGIEKEIALDQPGIRAIPDQERPIDQIAGRAIRIMQIDKC